MSIRKQNVTWLAAGMLWALISGLPAAADDTELFVGSTATLNPAARPNVLLILDTSGSMTNLVPSQGTFDPSVVYTGGCVPSRVYWRGGTGGAPDCTTARWFDATSFMCQTAINAFATAGRYTDRMGQYDPGSDDRWERVRSGEKSRLVECEDDSGSHGDGGDPTEVWAQDGDDSNLWSNDSNDEIDWTDNPRNITVYDFNYLNYINGPSGLPQPRIDVMKAVATSTLSTVNGVNVGLMRFNIEEGGPIIHAMENITTARSVLTTTINGLPPNNDGFGNFTNANGWTPLSETLYEAGLYYMGRPVDYGNLASPQTSVTLSRDPTNSSNYLSPIEYACQKNFVVLLTDGQPTRDVSAQSKIEGLPGFNAAVGRTGTPACDGGTGNGACLDDMAEYMYKTDLNSTLGGLQNVITHTIGFAADFQLLEDTALRGGGTYFVANDTAQLSTALTNIVTAVLETQTTFTAPAVSVNSFNRTRNLNDLFITVFEATGDRHWPGNLKKYRLDNTLIVDADGAPAVDTVTGFFDATARSYWSPTIDGSEVVLGGAANQIPPAAARNIFTYLSATPGPIKTLGNVLAKGNAAITDALLGIGNPGDPTRAEVLDFARGTDVTDEDDDGDMLEDRNAMGDPLHASPQSVIYGPTLTNAVVFFATNDGYLHAIDPDTGVEKWAFVPPELLGNLVELHDNESSPNKLYGIDGDIVIQTKANNDGVIDATAGEKVYLYFGLRRGGNYYYALDVTDPDAPEFMWRLDSATLPNIGQTWAAPVPTRVNIASAPYSATNATDKLVLVLAGGYDTTQDNLVSNTDSSGNALYIIDSVNGNLLWSASDSGANFNNANMDYSIPADIKVLDLDGDRFADRMFAADMGGQVWRFDIANGQNATNLVRGGVIAELGSAAGTATAANSRRMYYSPDVALISDDDHEFLHIGVGSGHRAHPNSVFTQDRFYALRNFEPFQAKSQTFYDTLTPVVEADLVDVTTNNASVVPPSGAGWKLELRDGGWIGEKVLAESRTFNNQVFFTTFTPGAGTSTNNCEPALGVTKLYVVDIFNGGAVHNFDGVGDLTNLTVTDRWRSTGGSISSEVIFLFPSAADPSTCVGDACTPPPVACVDLFCFLPGFANEPNRTTWSEEDMQ